VAQTGEPQGRGVEVELCRGPRDVARPHRHVFEALDTSQEVRIVLRKLFSPNNAQRS